MSDSVHYICFKIEYVTELKPLLDPGLERKIRVSGSMSERDMKDLVLHIWEQVGDKTFQEWYQFGMT